MKDDLIKIIAACFLVTVLSRCMNEKTKIPSGKTAERFKPFKPLAVVPPQTYEDVIKEAFKRMSSGEKIPNINCSVKMDLAPEDSVSLTNYIIANLKKTINSLPTPTKVAPMLGEDFAVIDLSGFVAANEVAVVTFTLFHKKRFFGLQCRAVATRGSDLANKVPWFIHKIHYAQEDPSGSSGDYKVKGKPEYCKIEGSVIEEPVVPNLEEITYPPELEQILIQLQTAVPKEERMNIPMGVDTRLFKEDVDTPIKTSEEESKILGNSITFDDYGNIDFLAENNPSSVLWSNVDGKKYQR